MPANRPRRKRIRAIAIIIFGRTIEKLDNNEDGTVFEAADIQLAKVAQMFDEFSEMDLGFNTNVDTAFDAFADYVEENEQSLDEQTLQELTTDIQNAW